MSSPELSCLICEQRFHTEEERRDHHAQHHGSIANYSGWCAICQKEFDKIPYEFMNHFSTDHKQIMQRALGEMEKMMGCEKREIIFFFALEEKRPPSLNASAAEECFMYGVQSYLELNTPTSAEEKGEGDHAGQPGEMNDEAPQTSKQQKPLTVEDGEIEQEGEFYPQTSVEIAEEDEEEGALEKHSIDFSKLLNQMIPEKNQCINGTIGREDNKKRLSGEMIEDEPKKPRGLSERNSNVQISSVIGRQNASLIAYANESPTMNPMAPLFYHRPSTDGVSFRQEDSELINYPLNINSIPAELNSAHTPSNLENMKNFVESFEPEDKISLDDTSDQVAKEEPNQPGVSYRFLHEEKGIKELEEPLAHQEDTSDSSQVGSDISSSSSSTVAAYDPKPFALLPTTVCNGYNSAKPFIPPMSYSPAMFPVQGAFGGILPYGAQFVPTPLTMQLPPFIISPQFLPMYCPLPPTIEPVPQISKQAIKRREEALKKKAACRTPAPEGFDDHSPPHDCDREFLQGFGDDVCPRCDTTKDSLRARTFHYKRFHYAIFYNIRNEGMTESEIWVAEQFGGDVNTPLGSRVCRHCDLRDSKLFQSRRELLLHMVRKHESVMRDLKAEYKRHVQNGAIPDKNIHEILIDSGERTSPIPRE